MKTKDAEYAKERATALEVFGECLIGLQLEKAETTRKIYEFTYCEMEGPVMYALTLGFNSIVTHDAGARPNILPYRKMVDLYEPAQEAVDLILSNILNAGPDYALVERNSGVKFAKPNFDSGSLAELIAEYGSDDLKRKATLILVGRNARVIDESATRLERIEYALSMLRREEPNLNPLTEPYPDPLTQP